MAGWPPTRPLESACRLQPLRREAGAGAAARAQWQYFLRSALWMHWLCSQNSLIRLMEPSSSYSTVCLALAPARGVLQTGHR